MKYAASIRYGGQLVDAEDCDYEDYKNLQLLCPECKEAVFLQKASTRKLAKKITIPAHFKHFSCLNPELIKVCEARVKQYDQAEIDKRKSQARNQRLKVLQANFWNLFLNNCRPLFNPPSSIPIEVMSESIDRLLSPRRELFFTKKQFKSQEDANNFYNKYIAGQRLDYAEKDFRALAKNCMLDDLDSYLIDPDHDTWIKHRQEFSSKANIELSKNIFQEIIDFICSKNATQLRANCFAFGILNCTFVEDNSPEGAFNWLKERLASDDLPLWRAGASSFVMELVHINWAKALSDPEKYKTGAFTKELVVMPC